MRSAGGLGRTATAIGVPARGPPESPPCHTDGAGATTRCDTELRRNRGDEPDPARATAGLRCPGARPADDRRLRPRLRHGPGDAAPADAGRSHGGDDAWARRHSIAD